MHIVWKTSTNKISIYFYTFVGVVLFFCLFVFHYYFHYLFYFILFVCAFYVYFCVRMCVWIFCVDG